MINLPGERPRHFIRGQIRVPIHGEAGCLGTGIWFLHLGEGYSHLPWNHAPLAHRPISGLTLATGMVLRARALFRVLPLVNWDLILTPSGPVILEGNTAGDWILTNLSSLQWPEGAPLVPLLRRWIHADR